MKIKDFFQFNDIGLLGLLFSDAHPDFVDAGSPYQQEVKWLAWHALLTKKPDELTAWLDAITSPSFRAQMRHFLHLAFAWSWMMQYNRKQIEKILNVLDDAEAAEMREHLNSLKPFYRQWKQRQIQLQIDNRVAA